MSLLGTGYGLNSVFSTSIARGGQSSLSRQPLQLNEGLSKVNNGTNIWLNQHALIELVPRRVAQSDRVFATLDYSYDRAATAVRQLNAITDR